MYFTSALKLLLENHLKYYKKYLRITVYHIYLNGIRCIKEEENPFKMKQTQIIVIIIIIIIKRKSLTCNCQQGVKCIIFLVVFCEHCRSFSVLFWQLQFSPFRGLQVSPWPWHSHLLRRNINAYIFETFLTIAPLLH